MNTTNKETPETEVNKRIIQFEKTKFKKIIIIFFLTVSLFANSQSYSIRNLLAFNIVSVSELDSYLHKGDFEMTDSNQNSSSLSFIYTRIDPTTAELSMISISREPALNMLTYSFYNIELTEKLTNELYSSNFKLINTYNKNGSLEKHYLKEDYNVIVSSVLDTDTGKNTYMFCFYVKSGNN